MLNTIINKYKTSKAVKTIVANLVSLSTLNAISLLVAVITFPYLVRVLGVEKYGAVNFSYSLVNYFVAITSFGFSLTGTRKVAQQSEDKDQLSHIFSSIFFTKIVLGIISLIVFSAIIILFPKFNGLAILYYFAFSLVLGNILFPVWFFQGIEKMKYITYSTLINRIAYLILIFTFIKSESSFIYVPLYQGGGIIIGGLFSMYIIIVKFKIRLKPPSLSSIKKEIYEGYKVFFSVLLPSLYNNSTTFILGLISGDTSVGYYTAALKPVYFISAANDILTKTFFPFLSKNSQHHHLYKKIALGIGFFIFIVTLLSTDLIIDVLMGPEYINSKPALYVLSITPVLLAFASIYGTNYLLVHNKDRLYLIITLITSFSGLIGAFFFIYYFDHLGAAINLIFSRSILAIALFIAAKKINIENQTSNSSL